MLGRLSATLALILAVAAATAGMILATTLTGDAPGAPAPAFAASPCADIENDGDSTVHIIDAMIVSSYFGQTVPPAPKIADQDSSGTIDLFNDILGVLTVWGTTAACSGTESVTTSSGGALAVDADGESTGAGDTIQASRSVGTGSTFRVTVHLTSNPAITGYQVRLTWDDSLLSLSERDAPTNDLLVDNAGYGTAAGQVFGSDHIELVALDVLPTMTTSYTGPVVQFELTCDSPGTSDLTLESALGHTSLASFTTEYDAPSLTNAQVTCGAGATPTPTPTPTPPPSPPPTPPPPPGMALNVTQGAVCDAPQAPTTCTVLQGGSFTLSVDVTGVPTGGYIAFQTEIDYLDLISNGGSYQPGPAAGDEIVWPAGGFPIRTPAAPTGLEGAVNHGDLSAVAPPFPPSFHIGSVVELSMTCSSGASTNTINLNAYGAGNTDGAALIEDPSTYLPFSDSLTIECQGNPVPGLQTDGLLSLSGGKASILAGQTVRWECFSPDGELEVTLRFHYLWGDEDVTGTGTVALTHAPPVQLLSVECLVDSVPVETILVNFILIDPSGKVFDAITSAAVVGATVTLEYNDGGTWRPLDAGDPGDQLLMDPDINPQTTSLSGRYGWDVAPGEYRVQVTKTGCTSNTGGPVTIPPPVTDLDIGIACNDPDGDGLPSFVEHSGASGTATSPTNPDTDGDTVPDGDEDCDNDSLTNLVEVASTGTDPCGSDNVDSDSDGCSNIEELGADPMAGGDRNSSSFWDFFDVWTHPGGLPANGWERTGSIDLFGDIYQTQIRFGAEGDPYTDPLVEPADETGYHPAYDRSKPDPAGDDPSWKYGRGNGIIDLFVDILGVAEQFSHACSGPF